MDLISRRIFEGLLVIAAVAETAHLIGLFDRRSAVDGLALAVLFTAAIPWVTVLVGLAITRLRSRVAKYGFLLLMAPVWFSMVKLGVGEWWGDLFLTLGFLAGVLQTLAVLMLLTPPGWSWTRRRVAGAA